MLCGAVLVVPMLLLGCGQKADSRLASDLGLGPTIGSVADLVEPAPVAVEGYGLVTGLAGTGSPVCPPQIRQYLKRYISVQQPAGSINVDELIKSDTTAVVRLEGLIPPAPSKNDRVDVKVTPLPGSGTTSLQGGWLPRAELHVEGTIGGTIQPVVTVEGGVFVDVIEQAEPSLATGYVLGGGRVQREYVAVLTLPKADYLIASTIRNRLSERYGPNTARSVSPSVIEVTIPTEYRRRKARFLAMVPMTFLAETAETTPVRIDKLIELLAVAEDKEIYEIALEAIGRDCLPKLRFFLGSVNDEVRFRAARCMLNLRDDSALETLRTIALDQASPYRMEALDAITKGAQRNAAVLLARGMLRDPDRAVVLAAYEYLREMGDAAVEQEFVGRSFYLERVRGAGQDVVFVSRSGDPRVVIFGGPLECRDNTFVESPDGRVVINSRAGQEDAFLMRRDSEFSSMIGPVRSGLGLTEIVRVLGAERGRRNAGDVAGLGACYSDVAAILEQMCAKDAVPAVFWAGSLPKFGPIIKKP